MPERGLPISFFDRPAVELAPALLGCQLVRWGPGPRRARYVRIVETEAYHGADPASHSYRGPTRRNRSMFLGPGHLYVYRIHQVHCLNVTARPGEAVLLRAAEPLSPALPSLKGPGRLARGLELDLGHDGIRVGGPVVALLPRDGGPPPIRRTPRVGISRAKDRRLRFVDASSPGLSRPLP